MEVAGGIRKAALLLMGLDPATAAELLRSASPEIVTQIAAELAYLQSAEGKSAAAQESAQEFFGLLGRGGADMGGELFLREMLKNAVGEERSQQVLGEVNGLLQVRDPFRTVRSAEVGELAQTLSGESAQVAAMVLMELPPAKSAALLPLLDEEVQPQAVRSMTAEQAISPDARQTVANAVSERLAALRAAGAEKGPAGGEGAQQAKLRKVAVLLRGLNTELRDNLLGGINEQSAETGEMIRNLMVVWEDLLVVADRSLQEGLRTVDSGKLALALYEADGALVSKVRANISERAGTLLDEEAELLSSPKPEEIEEAKQAVLAGLREMNAKGELEFEQS